LYVPREEVISFISSSGAKSKGANGVVAAGFTRRNRYVFKQNPIDKRKVIAKSTPILAKRKGPFPGGKRVGRKK